MMMNSTSPKGISDLDHALRVRVAKLRWMGLESEAEELIRMLEHDIAKAPTHYGRQLPRIWEATD